MSAPAIERLNELLVYEPATGAIKWKNSCAMSHRVAGADAGWVNLEGYAVLSVDARQLKAHRVAWAMYYGEWPAGNLDHINGVRSDNRISNLRVADYFQNQANTAKRVNNTSGYKGVCQRSASRWQAQIRVRGRQIYLGSFPSPEEASCAYVAAAEYYFGDFLREQSDV
jgi:hypothetical protein